MPSSARVDVGVEVANELDSFVEFSQEAGATLKNPKMFVKVSDRIKEADEKVLEMELHINSLIQKVPALQSEGNFFLKFNEAKRYLRETRQELRNLAMKTVLEVRDLKALLGGVDENTKDTVLLKISLEKMKNLMIETTNEVVANVLEADTEDFREDEKYKEKIDVVCRWVNIISFGLCGIIHHHVNTIPLEEAEEALEQLTTLSKNMLEKGSQLTHDIDEAIAILTEEIELINEWANSAENVKRNIDEYPEKYLAKYISIKTIFINGLNDLSEVAEKFIAQPPTIW